MHKSEAGISSDTSILGSSREGDQQAEFNVNPGQRQRMISEAAYFLAEHRGFIGGDPVQDWLAAESELNVYRM